MTRYDATALPGWSKDDHVEAIEAFQTSLNVLERSVQAAHHWTAVIQACTGVRRPERTSNDAEAFFRGQFDFLEVTPEAEEPDGITFTGFYEPVVRASRTKSAVFPTPLYLRPTDLVALVDDRLRGARNQDLTYARQAGGQLVPYWTRAEIADGALDGRAEAFAFVADELDALILQVQGSGVLQFENGTQRRITYDGKNGHPYVSVGKYLISQGAIPAAEMTMARMVTWLRALKPPACQAILNQNPSFVFFAEQAESSTAALGAAASCLIPGRSIAVDAGWYPLGALFYIAPDSDADVAPRLAVAHDVGSAIRGPRRVDIFFGTGEAAGVQAGRVRHGGRVFVALPKSLPSGPHLAKSLFGNASQ